MFIAVFASTVWGILGIVIVLAVGLVLMLLVKMPNLRPAAPSEIPGSLS